MQHRALTAFEADQARVDGTGLRQWAQGRLRLLGALAVGVGAAVVASLALRAGPGRAVESVLADRGVVLRGDPWVVPGAQGVLLLAAESAQAPADLYLLGGQLTAERRVRSAGPLYNLTHSAGADEQALTWAGDQAYFVVRGSEGVTAIGRVDFSPAPEPEVPPEVALRRGISNWQQTGRWEGLDRHNYRFAVPVEHVALQLRDGSLRVDAGLSGAAEIDVEQGTVTTGGDLLRGRRIAHVVPAWVPWLVDRARATPWIGPEAIAWLEQRVFGVRDQIERAVRTVQQTDHAAEVAEALPLSQGALERLDLDVEVADSGWPPPAVEPVLEPAVEGEGEWRPVADDPYVRNWPGGPPLFYQAFLRGDPERPYNKVYLTLWDPRLLQLHIVSGIEEPVSATGETGRGTIPKDPETLSRLVGAFNGGFQALHGEFGMMTEGRVYLPPKPWAATVAVFRDGSVGMGSWPGPERGDRVYDEAQAVAGIPDDMVAMRQNLTSLVEDGRLNPWKRWWWGAAPSQSNEQTLTQRSALCLRDDGLMLYAWGDFLSPDALGRVLVAADCARAMHLDMNAGHTGFEFYNVLAPEEDAAPSGEERSWQHEGPLRGLAGYTVRARKAVTAMQMGMPRYIRKDPRDFFYLTIKPSLPGPAEVGPGEQPVRFETRGLPQGVYPAALARHEADRARFLRIDPRRVKVANARGEGVSGPGTPLVELALAPAQPGALHLVLREAGSERVAIEPEATRGAGDVLLARGLPLTQRPQARAWLGIDRHGFLVYAESGAREVPDWRAWCERLGVQRAIALSPRERLGLRVDDVVVAPDGRTVVRRRPQAERVVLAAREEPAARVLFTDNEPRPYYHWAALQDQRVRYFRNEPPTARAPAGALAPGVVREPTGTSGSDP